MALSDKESQKDFKRNKNRSIEATTSQRWSDKQKLEAVNSYLVLGNLALTGRVLGIPEITLRVWKTSEWWKKLVEEIKLQETIELSNRLKSIVTASQNIVEDRLVNGDVIYDQKTGQLIRKPVNMKDAHKVAVDLLDRRKEIEKAANQEAPSEERNDNKLEKLAERFAEMATKTIEKNINKKRTLDVPFVEIVENNSALHEEREEGLQTGERVVQQSPGADQEAVGTNDSTETS